MDKQRLNNEIILCRPAVRKAKVAVIRKILKKMKILKTCKIESMKEKKLHKSEKLFEKVQVMKRVKADEVTKFALKHPDLQTLLKEGKISLKENALACLAQHDAVKKKINSIKEQFPNWETDIPLLLDFLGKKTHKNSNKEKSSKIGPESDTCMRNVGIMKTSEDGKYKERHKPTKATVNAKVKKSCGNNVCENNKESENKTTKNTSNSPSEEVRKTEKIDDPFFIEKKVIAPKLTLEKISHPPGSEQVKKFKKPFSNKEAANSVFYKKPHERQRDSFKFKGQVSAPPVEEKVHPSWAAKKVKLIRPFEGKKIKFSDN